MSRSVEVRFSTETLDPLAEEKLGTILTLANGRIGVRGELELFKNRYGTFVNGIYNYSPIFYRELVNLPRVVGTYIYIDGFPLWSYEKAIRRIERVLDVTRGIVRSRVELCWDEGCLEYRSVRLVHRRKKDLVALKVEVSQRGSFERLITIVNPIEASTLNPQAPEELMVKHYRVKGIESGNGGFGLGLSTLDGRYSLGFYTVLEPLFEGYKARFYSTGEEAGIVLAFNAREGERYAFVKYTSIVLDSSPLRALRKARAFSGEYRSLGWDRILGEHEYAWREIWDSLGFRLEGDDELEKALIFNAFHLFQLVDDEAEELAVAAKGLHGLGYRGHVFWDTEIYVVPFFTLFMPRAARAVLRYRCSRLEAARRYASSRGYRGARFPWESADDGVEATPRVVPLDLRGERRVEILTGDLEEHITADIAYAVDYYYSYTRDDDFMRDCGLKLVFETARYWASRAEFDPRLGFYVIRRVMGPDEYHGGVDNSLYTNLMAKYNLEIAVKYYRLALSRSDWEGIVRDLGVTRDEAITWERVASRMYRPGYVEGEERVVEQFDGYSRLEDATKSDPYCVGEKCVEPEHLERIHQLKLVKQADVVLAMFLLPQYFSREEVASSYKYYLARTTHGSSLSLPIYAGIAARIDLVDDAYRMLKTAAKADLEDVYGNVEHGLHVASSGGVWLALVHGFLGLSIANGSFVVEPRLPSHWSRVELKILGGRLRVAASRGSGAVTVPCPRSS